MKIISRADAKHAGLKRYFTGLQCHQGHIKERLVSDWSCVECSRLEARSPEMRARRREYMRDHMRRYREKHPDRVKATRERQNKNRLAAERRKWRALNPEKDRVTQSKSFQKHKAKRMAEAKAWRKKHKEAMRRYMRPIKVMRRAAEGRFDESDVVRMLAEQNNTCVACPTNIATCYCVDHVIPLARGGTHWPSNLQLLCGPCNRSKGTKTMAEWIAWKASLHPQIQPQALS